MKKSSFLATVVVAIVIGFAYCFGFSRMVEEVTNEGLGLGTSS